MLVWLKCFGQIGLHGESVKPQKTWAKSEVYLTLASNFWENHHEEFTKRPYMGDTERVGAVRSSATPCSTGHHSLWFFSLVYYSRENPDWSLKQMECSKCHHKVLQLNGCAIWRGQRRHPLLWVEEFAQWSCQRTVNRHLFFVLSTKRQIFERTKQAIMAHNASKSSQLLTSVSSCRNKKKK